MYDMYQITSSSVPVILLHPASGCYRSCADYDCQLGTDVEDEIQEAMHDPDLLIIGGVERYSDSALCAITLG